MAKGHVPYGIMRGRVGCCRRNVTSERGVYRFIILITSRVRGALPPGSGGAGACGSACACACPSGIACV
eukprot:16432889-Heterocapsa_arctica.AAC.1